MSVENTIAIDEISEVFDLQTESQWVIRRSTAEQRIEKLERLRDVIRSYEGEVKEALFLDLRKNEEAASFEMSAVYGDIDDAIASVSEWMKPVVVKTSAAFETARAKLVYEARGVVLLFGAWNFPFTLLFQPLVPIIAAGNCAIVKPNEMAPATSIVIAKIIKEAFEKYEIAVFEGGVDLANRLLELPVDHVFFTGSPAVGKVVMAAAAKHLASVTLELGGKNPVIVDKTANIEDAAAKIAVLRNMNTGQVCLCPENVYVHEDCKDQFIAVAKATVEATCYLDGKLNTEVHGKIVNKGNLARVKGYIDDAVAKGASIEFGGHIDDATQSIHPTIFTNVPDDAKILGEEVFGPILSVFTYKDIDEVYRSLHKQEKPLALYVFSENDDFIEDVLSNTSSGGVTVNHCVMHYLEHNLPFGGVNGSGMGRYHGVYGFKELSHERAVLHTVVG